MKKILVTGNAGSGKSTLSRLLGQRLGLPVFSLDKVVWKAGWQKPTQDERQEKLKQLLSKKQWVIDGVSFEVMKAADTVIFLDFPLRVCLPRVIKRNWKYLFKSRPELPDNCPEILIIPRLLKIMWNFPQNIRPKIIETMVKSKKKKFFQLKGSGDLISFLQRIAS